MARSENKSTPTAVTANPAQRSTTRFMIGCALIMIIVGCVMAVLTFSDLKAASKFETWSRAQATVMECSNERSGVFPNADGKDSQTVICQFTTAGRIVRKLFHSPGWTYHKGQIVEMRFDPFAPSNCLVSPSDTASHSLWGSIVFAFFVIGGCGLLIFGLKRLKKEGLPPAAD